jgi:hypothetical protein
MRSFIIPDLYEYVSPERKGGRNGEGRLFVGGLEGGDLTRKELKHISENARQKYDKRA